MARGAWHEEVDLVVVGASVGGLAAAVAAADRGCRTIVVERTKELGGGAASEAEMIPAAGSRWQRAAGIDDGPVRLAADVLAATHHHVQPELAAARATGDGLRLGREAGAATRRLASFLVTPFLATPGQLVPSAPLVDLGAVLVNQAGRRFADETAESLPLATIVRAQPGRVAYLLFGERMAAAARAADPFFARVVLPRTGRRGATLEDLAKQFELDAEGLRLTLETVNASLASGGDAFGRARFAGPLEPPFHAIRVTGARWRSLGGLAVDGTARVLDAEGQPIPGLYAAAGAAAGLGGER